MNQVTVHIDVPADIFVALNETTEEFKKDFSLSAAIWMYKSEKLSLAKAASLAGYHRYEFEKKLAENNIPINLLSVNDVYNDVSKIN
jgi:predicted HTH domain antitoxin